MHTSISLFRWHSQKDYGLLMNILAGTVIHNQDNEY